MRSRGGHEGGTEHPEPPSVVLGYAEVMDAAGEYGVGDVTVEIDGVEIPESEYAKGSLIRLGHDGSHVTSRTGADGSVTLNQIHDARRPLVLRLQRSSESNSRLYSEKVSFGATLRIRRRSGEVLFDGHVFRDEAPRDHGDERLWTLVAHG